MINGMLSRGPLYWFEKKRKRKRKRKGKEKEKERKRKKKKKKKKIYTNKNEENIKKKKKKKKALQPEANPHTSRSILSLSRCSLMFLALSFRLTWLLA